MLALPWYGNFQQQERNLGLTRDYLMPRCLWWLDPCFSVCVESEIRVTDIRQVAPLCVIIFINTVSMDVLKTLKCAKCQTNWFMRFEDVGSQT